MFDIIGGEIPSCQVDVDPKSVCIVCAYRGHLLLFLNNCGGAKSFEHYHYRYSKRLRKLDREGCF